VRERFPFVEVRVPPVTKPIRGSGPVHHRPASRRHVKAGEQARDVRELLRDVGSGCHQGCETALVRKTPHDHLGVDEHPCRIVDLVDAEVDVRSEAAVEIHLVMAGGESQLRSGEVHEREPDRLLPFADQFTLERQHRGMRFDPLRGHALSISR
jgi:hypothetical protein